MDIKANKIVFKVDFWKIAVYMLILTSCVSIENACRSRNSVIIDVPYIFQGERWPNGCESVSAVMVLKYYGFEIDVDSFIEEYLPCGEKPIVGYIGPDPAKVYCGDPHKKSGWGCYAPVIEYAMRKYISSESYDVLRPEGMTLDELCRKYIDQGVPVIIWATVKMSNRENAGIFSYWRTVDGGLVRYHRQLHCLVLCGYDDQNYYFNDPLEDKNYGSKWMAYPKKKAQKAYEIMGEQCVALVPSGGA